MTRAQWESLDELALAKESLEHHLSDPVSRPQIRTPAVDIFTEDGDVVVRVETPGVHPKDLDITVADDIFTIKGPCANAGQMDKARDYKFREIQRGTILRRLRLPCVVNAEQAKAGCAMGMLEIRLPKSHKRKLISVKVRVNESFPVAVPH